MDVAYLHLITNHVPIIGVPFGIFLLLAGLWRRSDELKTAAFLIFVFLGLATLATFLFGQGGEDFVEDLAGVSHDAIENHENFAKIALASVVLTAAPALFALLRYRGISFLRRRVIEWEGSNESAAAAAPLSAFPNWIVFAVFFLAFASAGVLGYTGKLGGKIRHTEFSGGAPNPDEEGGKNRRGKNSAKPEKIPPVAENEARVAETENDADEANAEDGKGRGRHRGGR